MSKDLKKKNFRKSFFNIVKLITLLAVLIGIPAYLMFFNKSILDVTGEYRHLVNYLQAHPKYSVFIYIGMEIFQVTVSVIPGQFFQMAAGSVFGVVYGLMLTVTGKIIGETIAYYMAKLLGRDGIQMFVGEKRMDRMMKAFNSEKAYVFTFVFYLIPGTPKDVLCFPAGISNMKFSAFILISTVARMPALLGSIWFGDLYMKDNFTGMISIAAICSVALVLGLIFRKQLHTLVDRIYEKIS